MIYNTQDSVSILEEKVFDILDRIEFFQGQRAGRELWFEKPKEVQDKDIAKFVEDIKYIRYFLKNSVILSKGEYRLVVKQYKNLEIKYSNLSYNYRLCKEENEILKQNIILSRKEKENK